MEFLFDRIFSEVEHTFTFSSWYIIVVHESFTFVQRMYSYVCL
jgi:hypothetical protein